MIQKIEKSTFTYKQAQRQYGIQGRSTVFVWLRKHGNLDWSLPKLHSLSPSEKEKTPEQRIKELETPLETERIKFSNLP